MKTRAIKAWTLLAALTAGVVTALASTALVLADHKPAPLLTRAPIEEARPAPLPADPLQPLPIGPGLPDTPDQPDEPDQPDQPDEPDKPVTPDPGSPRFDADITLKPARDGLHKFVVIISGRTVDNYGRAIPGADLEFLIDTYGVMVNPTWGDNGLTDNARAPQARRAEPMPSLSAKSDKQGNFRVRLTYYADHSARHDGYVSAYHKGYLMATSGLLNLAGGEASGCELVLEQGGTLSGVVIDQAGRPAPNVMVYAGGIKSGADTRTDAEGRFRLEGLEGGDVGVYAWSDGYRPNDKSYLVTLRPGEETVMQDIVLTQVTVATFEIQLSDVEELKSLSGEMVVFDHLGNAINHFWFGVDLVDGRYVATVHLFDLEGAFRAQVRLFGRTAWMAELTISLRAGPGNDLGLVYLMPDPNRNDADVPSIRPVRPRRIIEG